MIEIPKTIAAGVLTLAAAMLTPFLIESNTAGQILVITSPGGHIKVYTEPGFHFQGFGSVAHYNKRGQLKFNNEDGADNTINIRFNDGGTAQLSGVLNYELPSEANKLIDLHSQYLTPEAVQSSLIGTALQRSIFASGSLLSSTESYSTRRSDLFSLIGGQIREGVYATSGTIVENKEKDLGVTAARVSIQIDPKTGRPIIAEKSVLERYGITIPTLSLSGVAYDKKVQTQMEAQLEAFAAVQTSIAQSRKSEQDVITTTQKGLAEKAAATSAANVIKETAVIQAEQEKEVAVTKAEQQKEVAQLALDAAKLEAQALVEVGKGEAEARKLSLEADNGLKQKLEAYTTTQKAWADAFKEIKVPIVPSVIFGGGTSTGNTGENSSLENVMNLMSVKMASDLSLDTKIIGK